MFQYATKVKALIDAGTCASITTSTVCGSSSTSSAYYETFVYNNKRVVISSGVPNHNAEYNQTLVNPNTRCEYKCVEVFVKKPKLFGKLFLVVQNGGG